MRLTLTLEFKSHFFFRVFNSKYAKKKPQYV